MASRKYSKKVEYYTDPVCLEKAREIQGGIKELKALHEDMDKHIALSGKPYSLNAIINAERKVYSDSVHLMLSEFRTSCNRLIDKLDTAAVSTGSDDFREVSNELRTFVSDTSYKINRIANAIKCGNDISTNDR